MKKTLCLLCAVFFTLVILKPCMAEEQKGFMGKFFKGKKETQEKGSEPDKKSGQKITPKPTAASPAKTENAGATGAVAAGGRGGGRGGGRSAGVVKPPALPPQPVKTPMGVKMPPRPPAVPARPMIRQIPKPPPAIPSYAGAGGGASGAAAETEQPNVKTQQQKKESGLKKKVNKKE